MTACPECNPVALESECGLSQRERMRRLSQVVTHGRPGAEAMLEAAHDFLRQKTGMLSLYGTWGNGKSLILQALVNECREQGVEARYITATELIMWLREAFDEKILETDRARVERLARVPVLCIDELDKARDTPFAREMQQHLIDRRYRDSHLLGTVFAWNGSFNVLGLPAVSSRLSEFSVVENTDPDLRPIVGALKKKQRDARREHERDRKSLPE